MNITELKEKISSYPNETMPFCLGQPFSWRGVYTEVCFSLSVIETSKKENLASIDMAINNHFEGYKGGDFTYNENTPVHFEENFQDYSDGDYLIRFLARNHNEAITHIFGD